MFADAVDAVQAVGFTFDVLVNEVDVSKMRAMLDDSIIQDAAAEKAQDMAEAGVTLNAWEYRMKWLGEDEQTARAHAAEIGAISEPSR